MNFFKNIMLMALFCAFLKTSFSTVVQTDSTAVESLLTSSKQTKDYQGHIMFAADNEVTLYINGVVQIVSTDWETFAHVPLSLKEGDVIGLKARDLGVWYGLIAELVLNGVTYVTGRDNWLASKASDPNSLDWTKPNYPSSEICAWKRPVVLPEEREWVGGKAFKFTDPTAARYVWAEESGEGDTIFMRLRVGGDKCAQTGKIHFSANTEVEQLLNGKIVGRSNEWRASLTMTEVISKGDVIAFRVKNTGGFYGVIAAIEANDGLYATGDNKTDWRISKAFNIKGDPNAWMYPTYSACRWEKPVLRNSDPTGPGRSLNFPYESTGAKYVWAPDSNGNDEIFLRTVIGGQC